MSYHRLYPAIKLGFVGLFQSAQLGNNYHVIASQCAHWRGNLAVKCPITNALPANSKHFEIATGASALAMTASLAAGPTKQLPYKLKFGSGVF